MAYNNYYPMNYGYGQMNNPFPNQNQQQSNNGIIWVVGENGADSYLVAPGQTVMLWDSTAPVIYLKTADNMGRPSKRILDYTERGALAQKTEIPPQSNYVTKEELSTIKEEINSLRAKFDDMEGVKKK